MILIISIVTMLAGLLYSWRLQAKFNHYAQFGLRANVSGRQVAEAMLRDYGIYDVEVTCVPGQLTDHYNPADKTVNLSEDVYYGTSAVAAAVAAHECGHAVQHATAYRWLEFRSALVPLQAWSGWLLNIIFMASLFGAGFLHLFPIDVAYLLIIGLYGVITAFSLVTLPVEFDASRRALVWMTQSGVVTSQEHTMAKDALNTAAMTYVISALGSLATLLYYVMQYMGLRSDD